MKIQFSKWAVGAAIAVGLSFTTAISPVSAKTLRIGNDGKPQSMDPHYISTVQTSRISDDMFEGLLTYGPDGAPVPGAAESWDISEDGLTYTFHLRDAVWSDGVPVTAEDFTYAYKRLLAPEFGGEYASLLYIIEGAEAFNTGKAGPEALQAKALDDKTLQIKLSHPAPYFLAQLTHQTAFPIPKHTVEKYGDDWTKPDNIVVNGPYKLTEWVPNVHVKLEKNEKFHAADSVKIDDVIYYALEDRTAMQKRFRTGELDVARDIASEQIDWLKKNLADSLRIAPYQGTYYYVFRTTKKPFDDVRVRRALSMAINREAISDKVLRTGEIPAYAFVPPGTANYNAPVPADFKGMEYGKAVAKAKELLAEAGYTKDNPLKLTLRYNTSENHKRIAIAVQAMWKQLGVQAELFNTDGKIHYSDLKQGDFEIARAGWIADYNDAQNFLYLLETKTGPLNYSQYNHKDYDALMDKASVTTDLQKRAELMAKAEKMAMHDQPLIPIYYYVSKQLVSPKVKGWVDNAPDRHLSRWLDIE